MGRDVAVADGWDALVAERERLVQTLRRRCGVHTEAEDWAHDAILRVAAARGVDRTRVQGLVATVAWRIAVDALRAQERHRRIELRTANARAPATPEHIAIANRAAVDLLAHVDTLPPRQRAVFLMVAGGVPLVEASRALGLSYKSAESALGRARVRLRAQVGRGD